MDSCTRGVLHLLNVCLLSTNGIWSSGFLCDSLFWPVPPFSEFAVLWMILPMLLASKQLTHQEFFGREVHTTGRPSEIQGAAVQLGAAWLSPT